jgi:hypothetical protein
LAMRDFKVRHCTCSAWLWAEVACTLGSTYTRLHV